MLKALCPSTERVGLNIAGKLFLGCPTEAAPHSTELFALLRLLTDRLVIDGVIYGIRLTAAGDAEAPDAATFRDIVEGFRFGKVNG